MQDYIKQAYFSAGFFKDLVFDKNFKLVEDDKDCDEVDLYIMKRFDNLFGNIDAPSIFRVYVLNLYRAYCVMSNWGNAEARQVLFDEIKEDRMVLEDTEVLHRLDCFIRYAYYFRYSVYKSQYRSCVELRNQCKDTPADIKDAFDNPHDYWYYAGKMLLNYSKLLEEKLCQIEKENGKERCYQYCKDIIEDYQDLYRIAPTWQEEKEYDTIFEDTSYLTSDDKEELDNIVSTLQYYINTYEKAEAQKALEHLSLEAILKDCPKLNRIKNSIQKAIDYGCIEYRKGGLLGEEGLLIPIVKQGENTFPSDSAFAYFIGVALDLNERGEKFPELEVKRVFKGETKNGTQPDWAAYWRQQNRTRTDATKFKSRSQSAVYMVSPKTVDFVTRVLEG